MSFSYASLSVLQASAHRLCLPLEGIARRPRTLQVNCQAPDLLLPSRSSLMSPEAMLGLGPTLAASLLERASLQLQRDRDIALQAFHAMVGELFSLEDLGGMSDQQTVELLCRRWESAFHKHCATVRQALEATAERAAYQAEAVEKKLSGFSSHTIDILESTYGRSQSLNPLEIKIVADAAGITPQQVRTWFQNKRNRKRKTDPKRSTSTSASTNASISAISAPTTNTAASPADHPSLDVTRYTDNAHDSAIPHLADTLYPINESGHAVANERVIRTLPARRRATTDSQPQDQSQVDPALASTTETHLVPSDGSPSPPYASEDVAADDQLLGQLYAPTYSTGEQYVAMDPYTGEMVLPIHVDMVANQSLTTEQALPFYDAPYPGFDAHGECAYVPYSAPSVMPLDSTAMMAFQQGHQYETTQPELYQFFPNTQYGDTNNMAADFATLTTDGVPAYSLSSYSTPEAATPESQGQDRSVSSLSSSSTVYSSSGEGLATPMEDEPFLGMFIDASPAPTMGTGTPSDVHSAADNSLYPSSYFTALAHEMATLDGMVGMPIEWTQEQQSEIHEWIYDVLPFDQTPIESPVESFYAPSIISA